MRNSIFPLLAFLLGMSFVSTAQTKDAVNRVDLGIHGGTQGFGINGAYSFSNKFGVRLSSSLASFGRSDVLTWSGNEYNLSMSSNSGNAFMQAEYRPFNDPNSQSRLLQKLAITAGAAYFYKLKGAATGVPAKDYQMGDLTINKEDIGSINATAKYKPLAPYAGLALRQMKIQSKLSLNLDMGSHYLSAPEVTLVGDKLLSGNEANQAILENNLKGYRWLPVLQLGLSYHL
ncbi:MAG TPA: hypothetical protein PK110_15330 [Niabella sp.]|jgi:hypothetical protein|nr:hypothetical protein [Niabella sp.]